MNNAGSICEVMDKNYITIRERLGFTTHKQDTGELLGIDSVFKRLRPSAPFKLTEMLSPEFKPKDHIVFKDRLQTTRTSIKYSPEQIRAYYMYNHTPSTGGPKVRNSLQVSYHRSLIQSRIRRNSVKSKT